MNRREFIFSLAPTSLVGVLNLTPGKLLFKNIPIQIEFHGKLLKAENGKILIADDAGLRWAESANFGAECQVKELCKDSRHVYARMNYKRHAFTLWSEDGMKWRV